MQESAVYLSKRLRTPGGSRALRRQARAALKETYALEQDLDSSAGLSAKSADAVRDLAFRIDRIFRALNQDAENEFLRIIAKRYEGPLYDIGQRIRAIHMVFAALQADRLSETFFARSNWFWERSERAQSGMTGLTKPSSEDESSEPTPREPFELIWRKRKK